MCWQQSGGMGWAWQCRRNQRSGGGTSQDMGEESEQEARTCWKAQTRQDMGKGQACKLHSSWREQRWGYANIPERKRAIHLLEMARQTGKDSQGMLVFSFRLDTRLNGTEYNGSGRAERKQATEGHSLARASSVQDWSGCKKKPEPARGRLGLVRMPKFVKPVSGTHSLERVEARYSQDMERKELREGHSLWLGHRKKERKCSASTVQVCHSSEANK